MIKLVYVLFILICLFMKKEKVFNLRNILDEKIIIFYEESSWIGKDWKLIVCCCFYIML